MIKDNDSPMANKSITNVQKYNQIVLTTKTKPKTKYTCTNISLFTSIMWMPMLMSISGDEI